MDSEDEYDKYFEPITDQVLAQLASAEREFAASQVFKRSGDPPKPPPPKRQKVQQSSSEDSQLDAVPVVVGFGGAYFAPARVERRDPPRPPAPPQTKPSPVAVPHPISAKPAHAPVNNAQAPVVQPQPTRQVPAQQSRAPPPPVARQPSGSSSNGSPQIASRVQTPQNTNVTRQNTWNGRPSNVNAVAGPSRPSPKPPSTGQPYAQPPQGQRPPTVQRQPSRQCSPAVTPHTRQASVPNVNAQRQTSHQAQQRPPNGQVQGHRKPDLQRQNTLQRQHSNNASMQQQGPRPTQGPKDPNNVLNLELILLRSQVQELAERVKTAEEARYQKEGEVNILRANMSRNTQDHVSEISRLQAAREAAEAAKVQLVKEQKEEIERLKTQFTFRQHELETSGRRAPFSAQSKKIQKGLLVGTPIRTPSQMRAWNSPRATQGHHSQVVETPTRPRFGDIFQSPAASRFRPPPPVLGPAPNNAGRSLPGFENAFTPSARSASQATRDKGKGRFRESIVADDDGQAFFAPDSSPPSPSPLERHRPVPKAPAPGDYDGPSEARAPVSEPPSQAPIPAIQVDEDVTMDDAPVEAQEDEVHEEENHEIEPPNWRDEFQRLLFAHSVSGAEMPTLHSLLHSPLSSSAPEDLQGTYTSTCTQIMEHLSFASRLGDWNAYMQIFGHIMADLACILAQTDAMSQLSALFDLLRTLCYTIPSFTATLMTPSSGEESPRILTAVCDAIRTFAPTKNEDDERGKLAHVTLSLLEALAWNVPEDILMHLSVVILHPTFTSIYIARSLPVNILTHAVKLLALLATHSTLFRRILSSPKASQGPQTQTKELGNTLRHIHCLSHCLIDASRDGPEHNQFKDTIMTFFSTLALAHLDALNILIKSRAVIPYIIIYLSNLAAPIWEEDEELVSSPEEATRLCEKVLRAVALLYYLVFTPDPPFDLRHQLHRPPARHLMSIAHVFTVTMSRIGYTDLPIWLNEEQKAILDQAVGMSKLLTEHVVDGPELDSIWVTFHEDKSGGAAAGAAAAPSVIDLTDLVDEDEENEARLLHPADID